jgi:outer membrane protein OmpU
MNKLKKVGLTALAASLATFSATAGELSVTGSASIYYSAKEKAASTGFYQNDKIVFTGSGTMDNGMELTMGLSLDESDTAADTTRTFEGRYITLSSDTLGAITFNGKDGDSVVSALDDKMPAAYEESWDGADAPASFSDANSFYYSNGNLADGITLLAGYTPGGNGNNKGSTSIGATITAIDGLTVGLAVGNDNGTKTNETDYTVAYATYAMGPITVGVQMNDQDQTTTAVDEEMSMFGISYAVSEDMTISYGYSELDYEAAAKPNQEASAVGVSYTMGSIGFVGSYHDIENASGGTTDTANYKEYEIGLTFAF